MSKSKASKQSSKQKEPKANSLPGTLSGEEFNSKQIALSMYAQQQEMFIFRTKHFWSILNRMSVIIYAIIIFPYIYTGLKFQPMPFPNYWFSIVGMLLACFLYFILIGETARQGAVKKSMTWIAQMIGKELGNINFAEITPLYGKHPVKDIINLRYGDLIPLINLCIQLGMGLIFFFYYI